MSKKYFITGTSTNVGKTYVSVRLLKAYAQQGFSTLGLKPIASGPREDAMALQQASSVRLPLDQINPFAFAPPIAPHLAAAQCNRTLSVAELNHQLQPALQTPADVCIIEGAGGWHVPLNQSETMADFVTANSFEVILVVGMTLGCLNHAILTAKAIQQSGANLIGWIANRVDPHMLHHDENVATLKHWLDVPCLEVVNHVADCPSITKRS